MIRPALAALIGSAAIALFATAILFATPPAAPRPHLMRVGVAYAQEAIPILLTLSPAKEAICDC